MKILDDDTINKLGSELVLKDTSSVIKELIENCLDANSTKISVSLNYDKDKLIKIEISDNGDGISKDNLPLITKRYCTSKIREFSDLENLNSLGFRGEALSLISHNCDLTITSNTGNSTFCAKFKSGKLKDEVTRTIGEKGTEICIENLFSDNKAKNFITKSIKDKKKIVNIIWKYSFFHNKIEWKIDENRRTIFTNNKHIFKDQTDKIDQNAYYVSLTKLAFNNSKLKACDFGLEQETNTRGNFKYSLFFSKPNIGIRKKKLQLYINKRLVKNKEFQSAINRAYESAVMSINATLENYFCFLNLELLASNIDQNICVKKLDVNIDNIKGYAGYIGGILDMALRDLGNTKTIGEVKLIQKTLDNKIANDANFKHLLDQKQIFQRNDPSSQKIDDMMRRKTYENQNQSSNICNESKDLAIESQMNLEPDIQDEISESFKNVIETYSNIEECKVSEIQRNSSQVGILNAFQIHVQYKTMLLDFNTVDYVQNFLKQQLLRRAYGNTKEIKEFITFDKEINAIKWLKKVISIYPELIATPDSDVTFIETRIIELQEFLLKKESSIQTFLRNIMYLYGVNMNFIDFEECYRIKLEIRSHGICNELELDNISAGLFILRIMSFAFKNKDQNLPLESYIEIVNESYIGSIIYMIKREYYDKFEYPEDIGHELNSDKKSIITKFYTDTLAQIKKQNFWSNLNPNDYFVSVIDLDITYKLFERC